MPTDLLSCSRASIGYAKNADGTLTQFGNDTLRITDLGLLVEDARTNYVLQSEVINFIDNYWVNPTTNISITTDALIAPNGMTTADKVALTANAGDAYLWAYSGISLTANTYYAFSWYLKTDGSSSPWCEVEVTDGVANAFGAWFNLSTGLAGTTKTVGDATVLSVSVDTLTDGWYRCIVIRKVHGGPYYKTCIASVCLG